MQESQNLSVERKSFYLAYPRGHNRGERSLYSVAITAALARVIVPVDCYLFFFTAFSWERESLLIIYNGLLIDSDYLFRNLLLIRVTGRSSSCRIVAKCSTIFYSTFPKVSAANGTF